jgi:hypothetical protein
MGRTNWRYDPTLAEEALEQQLRANEQQLAQSAQQGQILSEGIKGIGDAWSGAIDKGVQGYQKGKQISQDQEAHALRSRMAEDDIAYKNEMRPLEKKKLEAEIAKMGRTEEDGLSAYQKEQIRQGDERLRLDQERVRKVPAQGGITPYQAEMLKRTDKRLSLEEKRAQLVKPGAKQEFEALPIEDQAQIKTIATKTGNFKAAANTVKAALVEFQKANTADDKIRIGRSMLKEMNSLVGSDAVGAEEVGRLGSALEYQIANFSGPGPFTGRDLAGFESQAFSAIKKMENAAKLSQDEINRLYGRPVANPAPEPVDPALKKKKGGAIAAPASGLRDPREMTDDELADELAGEE